jgi:hypothetical protein
MRLNKFEQLVGVTFGALFLMVALAKCSITFGPEKPLTTQAKIVETNGKLANGLFGNRYGSTLLELPDGTRQLISGRWGKEGEAITVRTNRSGRIIP